MGLISMMMDKGFERARKALQSKQKELKQKGKGNKPNASVALSEDEVKLLYEKELLGISSREALLNTVWFSNTIHFGLRGCKEHRDMCWGDVKPRKNANGEEYLEYFERQTKTQSLRKLTLVQTSAIIAGEKLNDDANFESLTNNDVPPTDIVQLSGHTENLQSVTNYSTVTQNQQMKMSRALANLATCKESSTSSISEQKPNREVEHQQQQQQAMALFSGAVIQGGHISISINSLNQSIVVHV
ncbi:Hypothetical predicted protein [Paramuricea clavata]|uniref:ZMYM2-like/QRICH1 C-terminal domain-containing protein n=1 Tax=Paramuricea clavata TaxID=317549 RepID=A0A6S7HEC1_PARCT|nr:Hypothetical predicted protein [Paramuricea clavata]